MFNKLNGKKHYGINRIRIYGEDENGNNTYIDTNFMGRNDFINANLNEDTGEIITEDFFKDLIIISKDF